MCSGCIGGKCHDEPKPESAVLVKCPSCEGVGCEHCLDGDFELTQCPYRYIGHYAELSHLCQLWTESGLAPVAGGVMDQAAWFVNMQKTLAAQKNAINAKELPDGRRR